MERTVESLEQDIKTEHNLYLRALADFENYRRRVDRERSHFGRETLREFVISLLDVVDDLERMLNFVEGESSPFIDGVRAVYRKLMKLLEKESIRPFDSIGKLFDPAQHEAVATAPADENTMGTIVQEVRKGYLWEDELLRTAQVVVAA